MTVILFACYMFLYCSEVGRFRVGVGLGACSNDSIHLYKMISIFYKCMQTIKLRQTTEKNEDPAHRKVTLKGYPCALKNGAKGVSCASESDAKGS